jgi:hypothetical protein
LQGLDLLFQPGSILLDNSYAASKTASTAAQSQAWTAEAANVALAGAIACAAPRASTFSGRAGSISKWHVLTFFRVS